MTQTLALETTYKRLDDGRWGVRVKGVVSAGQTVIVSTRDGGTQSENITRVVSSRNGIYICEIEPKPR